MENAPATPSHYRDPRLDRLLTLSDGVFAIALRLLAVEGTAIEEGSWDRKEATSRTLRPTWDFGIPRRFCHARLQP